LLATIIHTESGNDIAKAASLLMAGEVVAIPTETVYGLAGNALNDSAVLKIFKAKERPHFNPLIVHAANWESIALFIKNIPADAEKLAAKLTPGPLTFLLEKTDKIPDLVTAGHAKVAVRIPNHPLTQDLLNNLPFPLAAPSANRFGYVSPTTAQHVLEGLNGVIPYVLDGGPCTVGLESTIIDFEGDEIILRRKGGVSKEAIEAVAGKKIIMRTHAHEHPVAPGQLKSHYATETPLITGSPSVLLPQFKGKSVAVIGFGDSIPMDDAAYTFNLSPTGDTDEAARNLFAIMRRADQCGAEAILATLLPEAGLGAAINDRLKRAEHVNK
jgi:L-threonylcarbamoyladenylate synthase